MKACRLIVLALLALTLAACASLSGRDPLNVQVAGFEPLPGEGLELRFAVKLRVQNPNNMPVQYDGLALNLAVNGRQLASGVSDVQGSLPRFGETVISVPVTVSALSAARQALRLAQSSGQTALPYELSGKLGTGPLGMHRFSERGTLDLDSPLLLR
ncbi:LEA type 2 family protein [Stutzerimonas tarimensis]|uniref:LEA type 2 family protein n=1 Tax=Stutzerimonas tarimensis TaxID=1507735 RepID=A0ABV7T3Y5_9GAMM